MEWYLQFGESAHQIDDNMNRIIAHKYTGRFPYSIAVGDAKTLPKPRPSIYRPVVSATCGTETLYVAATSLKPAASRGVIPPPIMQ